MLLEATLWPGELEKLDADIERSAAAAGIGQSTAAWRFLPVFPPGSEQDKRAGAAVPLHLRNGPRRRRFGDLHSEFRSIRPGRLAGRDRSRAAFFRLARRRPERRPGVFLPDQTT